MFDHLQIYVPRERALVGLADVALAPLAWGRRSRASERENAAPSRVLLLRLERIGDLLMVLDAIAGVRAAWPHAEIDLAVGSWNAPLAALIPGLHRVEIVDVPWLAREGTGVTWRDLLARARAWRARRYDVVITFEPDIRSNILAWRTGAARRFGYWTGGGGALLTDALAYDPTAHVSANAATLVDHATGGGEGGLALRPFDKLRVVPSFVEGRLAQAAPSMPRGQAQPALRTSRLTPDSGAIAAADRVLADAGTSRLIGLHVSGGRESKQWHLDRFAAVGRALTEQGGTTLVLTGGPGDREMVDRVRRALGDRPAIDVSGALDLPGTAALLSRLDLLITGDTGPMHLAAAVGTPVVALFGPSDPRRYGPLATRQRVVRVQLWCSPCGQVRLPPERCRGHVPDCMDGITVDAVVRAAHELLAEGV